MSSAETDRLDCDCRFFAISRVRALKGPAKVIWGATRPEFLNAEAEFVITSRAIESESLR